MTSLQIENRPIAALRPFATNARTHSKKQLRQIADSIEEFGFTNPVLVDERGTILAGHGRVEAARMLGRTEVPCVRLAAMTETQKRAYVLADNKLALNAGWDEDFPAGELGVLLEEGFDVGLKDIAIAEVDAVLQLGEPEAAGDPADDALPASAPRRVCPDDLWQLDPHRLFCGDALDREAVGLLMGDELARAVFTDPPYHVPIQGHVGKSGRIRHREFAMAAGEMSPAEFAASSPRLAGTSRTTAWTARSISSAWTGATCGR